MIIKSKNSLDAWNNILEIILSKGKDFIDDDQRVCREVFGLKIEIIDTEDKVFRPIQILRKFEKWYYPSLKEIKQTILNKQAKTGFAFTYGQRIFAFKESLNQIDDFIIPLLKSKPNSRRGTIVLYDPLKDSNLINKEIPSLLTISFLIRDQKLNLFVTIRSCEMFFGWPANLCQMNVIQTYIAEKLNVQKGSFSFNIVSAHIFIDQETEINEVIG